MLSSVFIVKENGKPRISRYVVVLLEDFIPPFPIYNKIRQGGYAMISSNRCDWHRILKEVIV